MADVTEHLAEIRNMLASQGYQVAAGNVRAAVEEIRRLRGAQDGATVEVRKRLWTKPRAEQNPSPLKPCPEEPEHLCCYPACNCAPHRAPA